MISFLVGAVGQFVSCPALLSVVGLWFVLGCFRLLWWLVGGVENNG